MYVAESWFRGDLYIIEGSYDGKVYKVSRIGKKQVLIRGLRGGSDHFTSELAFGPDGKMYFAVGTVTNSGVVGVDNAYYGWLGQRPTYHDVPARDIILTGQNFPSDNPLTKTNPNDNRCISSVRNAKFPGGSHPWPTAGKRSRLPREPGRKRPGNYPRRFPEYFWSWILSGRQIIRYK